MKFTVENVKCVQRIKCVKVRTLLAKNKVHFARAEQLRVWCMGSMNKDKRYISISLKFRPTYYITKQCCL